MRKQTIFGIILLMAFALMGLMALQIYWVSAALNLKEQEFDAEVNDAMNKLVDEYELMMERRYLGNKFQIINIRKKTFFVIDEDTFESPVVRENMNISLDLLIDNPGLSKFWKDIPGKINEQYDQLNRINEINRHLNEVVKREEQSKWHSRRLIKRYIGAISTFVDPAGNNIDLEYLYKEMKEELQSRGIDLNFRLGVYQPTTDSLLTLGHAEKKKLLSSDFQVELYPYNLFSPSPRLIVYFPRKISFLLRTLITRLLSSLFFILIIIFSFGFTIYTIYRQKKVSEMKNDFINNMTHEFKTPLTTISLAGQALSDRSIQVDEERIGRFSNIIVLEAAKLGIQVEKILQMAVLDKGEVELKITEVDIHEIINELIENHKLRLTDQRAYIESELKANPSVVQGDRVQLSNAIDNLIDNALKYCKEYPEVKVCTHSDKDGLSITVEDRGVGMTPEARKKIFEKFYRVHTGNLHNVKGFGLGLAYVKTIIDAHQGHITVTSDLNKGSKFKIYIPYHLNKEKKKHG